ncbi:MAG: NAD-dependent epimerase/dehydratase family protein [Pyrinomonadaceae bacterium]
MKILVTGGSGYLGTHVRRFFAADDFSRRSHLDILSEHDTALIGDYDVVIHLAAYLDKSTEAAPQSFWVNAEGTANVLRQMQPNSCFIYASTKDVYGAHADNFSEVPETCPTTYCGQSPLEWSKLIGERYVDYYARERGIRAAIFRSSNIYAPASDYNEPGFVGSYVEAVKHGVPVRLPLHGTPLRDILHVEDFARACRAFIDSSISYGLYNLGGGRKGALTLRELVETIGRLAGRAPVFDEDAPLLPAPSPVNYISDLTRVQHELNWQTLLSIEEGLKTLL